MGFGDKFKMVKDMASMQSKAIESKVKDFEAADQKFKEKELELLGKFEDKLDAIQNELRTIRSILEEGRKIK